MICLRCRHRKFEYGYHANFGNCCLCANCRRYVVLAYVSPDEVCELYMGLIAAEVQIAGIQPRDLINHYWPFPTKNGRYTQMWSLWKEKAIRHFGRAAFSKTAHQNQEQSITQQLGTFDLFGSES